MRMDLNRFTEKAQQAFQSAQRLAMRFGHQQLDVEHLLLALLDQEQGLVPAILGKADISADVLKIKLQREIERQPKVSEVDQVYLSSRINRLVSQAEDEAKRLKDDFVSVE